MKGARGIVVKKSSKKPSPVKKATKPTVKSAKPPVKAKPSKASKAVATKSAPAAKGKSKPAPIAKASAKVAAKAAPALAPAKPLKPSAPSKPQLVQGSILKHGLLAQQKNGKHNGKHSAQAMMFARPTFRPTPMVKVPKPAPALVNRPVPVAVTTDGKPKKNQAGLSSRELDFYRDLLLAKRRELVGDMGSMEAEALRSSSGSNLSNLPIHMADMGTDNYEQEFTLGLVEKDRVVLREINQALAKIQTGTFGICEGTEKAISKARLEVQPWAKYSIEYARMLEKRMMR